MAAASVPSALGIDHRIIPCSLTNQMKMARHLMAGRTCICVYVYEDRKFLDGKAEFEQRQRTQAESDRLTSLSGMSGLKTL